MSRVIMKNGDVVNLEYYDWSVYRSPIQLQILARELRQKGEDCQNTYPGQKIIFCFSSEGGAIPDLVRSELTSLGIELQTWP